MLNQSTEKYVNLPIGITHRRTDTQRQAVTSGKALGPQPSNPSLGPQSAIASDPNRPSPRLAIRFTRFSPKPTERAGVCQPYSLSLGYSIACELNPHGNGNMHQSNASTACELDPDGKLHPSNAASYAGDGKLHPLTQEPPHSEAPSHTKSPPSLKSILSMKPQEPPLDQSCLGKLPPRWQTNPPAGAATGTGGGWCGEFAP